MWGLAICHVSPDSFYAMYEIRKDLAENSNRILK